MLQLLLWLSGAQRILTTTLPQYKQAGHVIEVAGECFRVVAIFGDDVWGRPCKRPLHPAELTIVESPLKQMRQRQLV